MKVTSDGVFGEDWVNVKSVVVGEVTVTPIDVVLEPVAFVAVMVTIHVPGVVNV